MNRRTLLLTLILLVPAGALAQSGQGAQSGQSGPGGQRRQSGPIAASGQPPGHLGLYTPREDAAAVGADRAAAAKAAAAAPRIAERFGLAPLAELADAAVAAPTASRRCAPGTKAIIGPCTTASSGRCRRRARSS